MSQNGTKNVVNDDGSISKYLEIEEPAEAVESATYVKKWSTRIIDLFMTG